MLDDRYEKEDLEREDPEKEELTGQESPEVSPAEEVSFYDVPKAEETEPAPAETPEAEQAPREEESGSLLKEVENRTEGEYVRLPAPSGTYEYYDDGPYRPVAARREIVIGEKEFKKAGVWVRLCAWLLDLLICAAFSAAGVLLQSRLSWQGVNEPIFFNWSLRDLFWLIIGVVYRIITDFLMGGTVGMRALRLRLISTETGEDPTLWQIVFRELIGKYLSAAVMGIGYLMAFSKGGTLYDRLANTVVVYDL